MKLRDLYKFTLNKLTEAGMTAPDLEASILTSFAIGEDKTFLLSHPEFEPTSYQIKKLKKYINKRINNYPIAYILNCKEFFGYNFYVNENVLIPRPESEFLVEAALKKVGSWEHAVGSKKPQTPHPKPLTVLDMGTGSGCIIISVAKALATRFSLSATDFFASDISPKALNIAKKNAKEMTSNSTIQQFSNLHFVLSDLFSNPKLHRKFDLIIANLPYVPRAGIRNNELGVRDSIDFEPQNAIFANDNGSSIIKKFLKQSTSYLADNGQILIELDPRNGKEIRKFAESLFPAAHIELKEDLANFDRYLIITK